METSSVILLSSGMAATSSLATDQHAKTAVVNVLAVEPSSKVGPSSLDVALFYLLSSIPGLPRIPALLLAPLPTNPVTNPYQQG
ncbi:hypothetical protein K443DRAFT_13706 [Laccaria amethystina LaAM-08-1]|uniref:Uncharacterized protein n=1 Tax=Laccaria amethystina LaAM-08-1 TaxID=1095629 RepID=A0A0C9X3S0_9AGAR|nr:hypothetical protein K443DRAFT_13706 [Laccaria amethystina LaAM-08-1]